MANRRDEFALIDWIRTQGPSRRSGRVLLGIGDDAALVKAAPRGEILVATDVLLEGVHFLVPDAKARDVGHKALAVNLSDLAAMAARPTVAVVGVAFRRGLGDAFAQDLLQGLLDLATQWSVDLVGGDTCIWEGPTTVCVTVLGEPTGRGVVRRSGARPGDFLFVTGQLGGSSSGKHLRFRPRIEEAIALHAEAELHAMIDISDGLVADLNHILTESGVGAILEAEQIPISRAAHELEDGRTPLEHALSDGEDFELLFAVAPEDARRLLAAPPCEVPLSHIGRIVSGADCQLRQSDGTLRRLDATGWRHRF
ncbi:MAG TPA: thiamine-phosphate kinase [Planctomycetaceae bacterium]|nr:thiamine-phosphate kinase [Planctomycetaceae bacterium]